MIKQRREEELTLMPHGLNPLKAHVDDIKLWQAWAADLTLAKAREEAGNDKSEKDIQVGSTTVMACFIGNGDQRSLLREM